MSHTTQIIAASLLDTWIAHDWSEGIHLASLDDLTEIQVQTRNSLYEVIVIDHRSGEVLIRGGSFFKERTSARVEGSSRRGSFLKVGSLHVGLNMEISSECGRIITSSVQSIALNPPSNTDPRPRIAD
jgi:hypothetical protein